MLCDVVSYQPNKKMRSATSTITVEINGYGEAPRDLVIAEDSTLRDALTKAGIRDLSASEKVWVNGKEASTLDLLDDGDVIQIVGKKEGGVK